MNEPIKHFFSYTPTCWTNYLSAKNLSHNHRSPLLSQVYKKRAPAWSFRDCPTRLKEDLKKFSFELPHIYELHQSRMDSSIKFILRLSDNNFIETVLMPETNRLTICLSSQVGCKRGCVFCHTGRMGLIRNLETAEIISQVYIANQWLSQNPEWVNQTTKRRLNGVTNIVFMGMGEPLDNQEEVLKALNILLSPDCFDFGPRKVCVSTAGHLEGLDHLIKKFPKISLAISLHYLDPIKRSKMMPINKLWPLDLLISKAIELSTLTRVMIQYTMIKGLNDSLDEAMTLADYFKNTDIKVNLIPFNSFSESSLQSSDYNTIVKFRNVLLKAGIRTMVRFSKGPDISAACGQLVTKQYSCN